MTDTPRSLRSPAAVLAAASMLLAACTESDRVAAPGRPPAAAVAPGPSELLLGQPIVTDLLDARPRLFQLTLDAGELVEVVVYQYGLDVVVRLVGPDGDLLIEHDKMTGKTRPERILWVADHPGTYHLEIDGPEGGDPAGLFEVELEESRRATDTDRRRQDAEILFHQARRTSRGDADTRLEAIEDLENAIRIWRQLGERPREADALYRLGRRQEETDLGQARQSYEQVLAILEEVRNLRQKGDTLHRLGAIHTRQGDLEQARDRYLEALPLRRRVGYPVGEGRTRNNLGSILLRLGDVTEALEHNAVALEIWRELGRRHDEAQALHNRGKCYLHLGRIEEALDDLELALQIRSERENLRGQASTLTAIGQAHTRGGERRQAFDAFRRSLEIKERLEDRRGQAVTLLEIGHLHQSLGRVAEARAVFEGSLALAREIEEPGWQAYALHALGGLREDAGARPEALDLYRQAHALMARTPDSMGRALVLKSMARAESRLGDWSSAQTHIEQALALIEQLRAAPASHAFRYSFFAKKQSYYELYVDLLMELHRQDPRGGHDAQALTVSERARARSQLDALAESAARIRHETAPELRQRKRSIEGQIESKELQRQALLDERSDDRSASDGKATASRLAAVDSQMRDLLRQYDRVQDQIRSASPRHASLTQPQPLDSGQIQRRVLDEETLLIELDLGEQLSYLWLVSPTEIRSFELPPRREIEELATRAYDRLAASHLTTSRAQTRLALEDLSRLLLAPIADHLGNQRLLIVTEGALQYIPFGALPDPAAPASETSPYYESPPLGESHEIVNMPSASTLAVLREQIARRASPEGTLAVLADPVFELDDPRVAGLPTADDGQSSVRGPQDGSRRFERLTFSRVEAERILSTVSTSASFAALDFDASRDVVTSGRLGNYRFLHFATHGELNTEHPEFSHLVLSRVDIRGRRREDGFLYAHEIYDLELPADLVVLSACETALGAEVRGEGLLGLPQSFFYAGAARVVVSLWKVDDQATSELMARFYENLFARGSRPVAALQEAQASIRREKRWQAPYYWAGFMLLGEWR
ncbi:MAG: CHAT domain-containing protein [bacterium]|nr:CHAT domain-containing protein [bacterium]